jgi:hypothetical protein
VRLGRIKLIHKNPGKQIKPGARGKGHILGGTSPDTRQQLRSSVTSTDDLVRSQLGAQNDRPVVSFNFVFTLEALLTLFLYLRFFSKKMGAVTRVYAVALTKR